MSERSAARQRRPAEQKGTPDLLPSALRSQGQPLDTRSRTFMEPRFGHDFSRVRIHTGARVSEAASRMNSLAFTSGQSIYFGANLYRPETPPGRRLLAHELAHTLQQGAAQPDAHLTLSRPTDALEREADAAAGRVAAGHRIEPGAVSIAATGKQGPIARQVATLATRDSVGGPLEAEELVQNLARSIFKNLQLDPEDSAGRVRRQLARLSPATREVVLDRVKARLSPEQWTRLSGILAEPAPPESGTLPALEDAPARPEATPAPTESPQAAPPEAAPEPDIAGAATTPDQEVVGETRPGAAPAPVTPDVSPTEGAGAEEVPIPEVHAEVPEPTVDGAPAPAPAGPEPDSTPAGAEHLPVGAEEGTADADTGPIEELEAEVQETQPEGPAEAPEPETPEPVPESTAPAADSALPEPVAGEAAPEEAEPEAAPFAPEEVGGEVEELAEGEDLSLGEPIPAAEAELGDVGAELALEDTDLGGGAPSGGGGGGGTPISEPPAPEVPDVSGAEPEQALAALSNLPPSRLAAALGGVSAAASRSVGEQRAELAGSPPQVERPSGAHTTQEGPAAAREAPPAEGSRRVERTPQGSPAPVPRPAPLPPAPAPPTQALRPPEIGGPAQSGMSEDDARALRASLHRFPTTDPALAVTAGPPPTLALEGDADPERAREQRAQLDESVAHAQAQGQEDASQPMGEEGLLPEFEPETLTAEIPGSEGAGVAGSSAAGGAPAVEAAGPAGGGDDVAESIVARQQRGPELDAAIQQARADVNARRQEHQTQAAGHRADAQRDMDELVNSNAADQAQERTRARTEVQDLRGEWSEDQRDLVRAARTDADAANRQGEVDMARERTRAQHGAAERIAQGNREAADARRDAEGQAARERREAERETSSGGVLGWLADRATAFFNGVKNRIQQAFQAAREKVRSAIQRAQEFAVGLIERARQAIVSAIRWVGDRLIEIGDRLLAGFPGLRDRFRNAIRERVARAEATVNRLAGELKAGVQRALNLLGAALNGALNLLERGMLAAVDAAAAAVRGAIQAARAAMQALAAFAVLIRDVAANPGQWIRNLGAAIMDGIRNHLWRALKLAMQNWFSSKVDEVLGLGTAIWRLLRQGGIALARVGTMVWEGLKQVIPVVLIQILIQKLVSMIVPAVGAVMAIIEGLQAAWGTVSRIIYAFERFFAFLRAVKTGNAGPQFAEALAAAAVAVIDFVSNWLLSRLRRPAGAIAGRIRVIAQRIGQRLRGVTQTIRRGRARVHRLFRRRLRDGRRAGQPQLSPGERKRRRLERAVEAIRPQADALLSAGVSRAYLWVRLQLWRARYLLTSLTLSREGALIARVNPVRAITRARKIRLGRALEEVLRRAEAEFIRQVEQDRTPSEQATVQEAERRARAGEGAMPPLSRVEQIILLRRMREGQLPTPMNINFGPSEHLWMRQQGTLASVRVNFPRLRVPRTAAPRGEQGQYWLLSVTTRGLGRRLGVPEDQIMHAVASQTPSILDRRIRSLRSRVGRDDRETFDRQLAPMVRRLGVLTHALEPARAPGMLPVTAVASRLTGDPRQLIEGRAPLGPMTSLGAASAIEEERTRARNVDPGLDDAETRRNARARNERYARIAQVFLRLRRAVSRGEILTTPAAEQGALQRLADAFDRWLRARLRPGARAERTLAAENLARQVVLFLQRFHG
jgi:hypothetical protein